MPVGQADRLHRTKAASLREERVRIVSVVIAPRLERVCGSQHHTIIHPIASVGIG